MTLGCETFFPPEATTPAVSREMSSLLRTLNYLVTGKFDKAFRYTLDDGMNEY